MKNNKSYKKIIKYFLKTRSVAKTAVKFNYSNSGIHYILKRYKISPPSKSESRRLYKFNEDYFEIINTEQKAYWLGFLYADGYVGKNNNKVTLALSFRDRNHIELFAKDINSEYPIKDKIIKSGKFIDKKYSILTIISNKTKTDLIKHGCFNNKSLILKFPTTVPNDLINHFIRGYFDGDGSVFVSKEKHHRSGKLDEIIHSRILGTYDFISKMTEILNFDKVVIKKNNNIFEFIIKRRLRCKILKDYLYENANVYLKRKKDIFDNYFKE